MSQFPENPHALSIKQIECISCKELITIAEDRFSDGRSSEYGVANNGSPDIHVRHQGDRNHLLIVPQLRTETQNPTFHPLPESEYVQIVCPRCGADNRNWLHVKRGGTFHSKFQFPWVIIACLDTLIIFALGAYFYLGNGEKVSPGINYFIVAMIIFGGIVPAMVISGNGRQWWEFSYLKQVIPRENEPFLLVAPPVRIGLTYFALLSFGFPFLFLVVFPVMWGLLQSGGGGAGGESSLPGLSTLVYFSLFVGTGVIISSTIATLGLHLLIREVKEQLPRPIFYSMANMTRVVTWEARRALEIGPAFDSIQWTAVQRLPTGGIQMEGILRDTPEKVNGRWPDKVKAQKYTITTDPWARIIRAQIKDIQSNIPPGTPLAPHPVDIFAQIIQPGGGRVQR